MLILPSASPDGDTEIVYGAPCNIHFPTLYVQVVPNNGEKMVACQECEAVRTSEYTVSRKTQSLEIELASINFPQDAKTSITLSLPGDQDHGSCDPPSPPSPTEAEGESNSQGIGQCRLLAGSADACLG